MTKSGEKNSQNCHFGYRIKVISLAHWFRKQVSDALLDDPKTMRVMKVNL